MRYFFLVIFFICSLHSLFGATCTTTSTTTWDCGTPGQNDDLIVNHSITITGDFTVNNGSITVNSPNTLTITGDLTFNNNSTVVVNIGGSIQVNGDFLNKNNSGDVEIFGTLNIDGNFQNGTGSGMGAIIDVGGTGSITYGGTCTNNGTVMDDDGSYSGDCNNPVLPVELIGFRVTALETGNLLEWETASETNNDYFEIQRSSDIQSWEGLAKIEGAGDSNEFNGYSYLDANPIPGRVFYRLKQVDFDGAFEFSYIISVVTGELPVFKVLKTYPNPTMGGLDISYVSNNNDPVTYSLIDPMGKEVLTGEFSNKFGSNSSKLSMRNLGSGLYSLKLSNLGIVSSVKILKN